MIRNNVRFEHLLVCPSLIIVLLQEDHFTHNMKDT
jgi:hypothetical protein